MKKTLSIVLCVLLVLLAVACSPESSTHVHEWEKTSASTATCEKDGSETWTCKICKESEVRPVEATGHTHAANVKGTVVTVNNVAQEVTCSENGLYSFRCTTCGKSFEEVVTPEQAKASKLYTVSHVYLADGEYVKYDSKKAGYEDHVQYLPDDIKEATILTAKCKVARCESCGETMPEFNVVADEEAKYALMNGMWVYKKIEDGKVTEIYYIDNTEKKENNGTISESAKVIGSTYTSSEGWSTGDESWTVEFETVGTGVRTLCITESVNKKYWIGETSEGYYISYDDSTVDAKNGKTNDVKWDEKTDLLKDSDGNKIGEIDFITGHNHKYDNSVKNLYNLSSDNQKINIYADESFTVMTYLGVPYCDGTNHYVECEECGLSYYKVACKSGTKDKDSLDEAACRACGFTSAKGSYYTVTISRIAAAFAEKAAEKSLASGQTTYTSWNNMTGSTTNQDAAEALETAKKALEEADEALAAIGQSATQSGTTRYKIATLLKDNGSSAIYTTSIVDAYKQASSLEGGDRITADTTGSPSNSQLDDYQAVLKATEIALIGLDVDPTAYNLDGSADKTAVVSGAAKDLHEYTTNNSVDIETFKVPAKTTLPLEYSRYTSFAGIEFDFAENTGWSWNSGELVVASDTGYKILGDDAILAFVTKY